MRSDVVRLSPQEVDPLSWLAGRAIPRILAVLVFVAGTAAVVAEWSTIPHPWMQVIAIQLVVLSFGLVDLFTRPQRARFTAVRAVIAVVPAWLGIALSALAQEGNPIQIEWWWAPIALGLALAALSPFVSVVCLVALGVVSITITAVATSVVFLPTETFWPPLTAIAISVLPVVLGVIAGVAVEVIVVTRMLEWLREVRRRLDLQNRTALDVDAGTGTGVVPSRPELDAILDRASAFVLAVAASGSVNDSDRAVAAHLARNLRDDLVTRADLSWLESIARGRRLIVLDPERRANSMTMPQRVAVRSLLLAVIESPVVDGSSVLVELRGHADGTTAVAMTIDLDLPEGRRVMLLAPYYLALKTEVTGLTWTPGHALGLKFQLPARSDESGGKPRKTSFRSDRMNRADG